jgi:serine O-acetyltransferase
LNQVIFGSEISSKCAIGPGIFFPHTSGTVVGASKVGRNRRFSRRYSLSLVLGDNVVVGVGAKVLGGISLGDNVKVGANSVLLRSVSPNAAATGIPAREVYSSNRCA